MDPYWSVKFVHITRNRNSDCTQFFIGGSRCHAVKTYWCGTIYIRKKQRIFGHDPYPLFQQQLQLQATFPSGKGNEFSLPCECSEPNTGPFRLYRFTQFWWMTRWLGRYVGNLQPFWLSPGSLQSGAPGRATRVGKGPLRSLWNVGSWGRTVDCKGKWSRLWMEQGRQLEVQEICYMSCKSFSCFGFFHLQANTRKGWIFCLPTCQGAPRKWLRVHPEEMKRAAVVSVAFLLGWAYAEEAPKQYPVTKAGWSAKITVEPCQKVGWWGEKDERRE